MPAILSAIFSVIYAWIASANNYKESLNDIFPAMNPRNSSYALEHRTSPIIGVSNFFFGLPNYLFNFKDFYICILPRSMLKRNC